MSVLSEKKMTRTYHWVLYGSSIYEVFKVIHFFALFKYASANICGVTTTILALIYLSMNILDCGATQSIAPFLYLFQNKQKPLKQFLIKYYLFAVVPIIIIGAAVATFFIKRSFSLAPHFMIIIGLIALEAMRSFMRMFLHITFHTPKVIILELASFFLYMGLLWFPFVCFPSFQMSVNSLLIPHFIDSIIVFSGFCIFTFLYYKQCAPGGDSLPTNFFKKLMISRVFNCLLRVGRNMFSTGNLITPVFALKFGVAYAGVFYVASTLATALSNIIKCVVYYAGNIVLAYTKSDTLTSRREVFKALSRRIVSIVFPVLTIIGFNYSNIVLLAGQKNLASNLFTFTLVFISIVFFEFFFLLYEQFYIIEELAPKFFIFKAIELVLFYGLTLSTSVSSPLSLLIGVIGIKIFSFIIVSSDAYFTWKIRLSARMKPLFFISCLVFAGLSFLVIRYIAFYYMS